jgi:hypothetical protein
MMLGREGSDLVRQLAGQLSGSGSSRTAYWGELVASSLPRAVVGPLVDRLKAAFLRQFAVRGGASIVARAIPFGIGAVVGGTGNNMLGRRIIQNSRLAFGPAPADFAAALDLPPLVIRTRPAVLTSAGTGLRRLGGAAGGAAAGAGRMARRALPWPRSAQPPAPTPED